MRFAPARPRLASNLERYGWFFTRISGVALIVLLGFHLFYMHVILGVEAIDFDVIAQRWESPFWCLYDLFMLVFGWIHGANGLRIVLDDYVHVQGPKVLVKSVLYVVAFILIVLGAYVIFAFKP